MKESKRMAVPSLVPFIISIFNILILSQKPWGVECTGNSLFSLTARSLIPIGHSNEPKSRALDSPWARGSKSHRLPAEAGSGKSCPHSPASSLQRSAVLCHPQESQVPHTGHPLAGLTGKEILITYQRLGGSVV
jgi:hypothetical protein